MCMQTLRQQFIQNLKFFRKQKGMRQLDLALEIGKSSNYINSIENGKYFPSPETIESIARSLGIEPVRLFGKCEESEKEKIAETVLNIEETLRSEVLESIQKAFSKIRNA
ncbi:helix-turn-helix transcriptional regulator [uncultured Treponema sp.]|uniref:helix-turn-helix domain-containing protein n=1 Tax=uncultured Treponema sp. TaxID=162155 RepID=UPI00338E827A